MASSDRSHAHVGRMTCDFLRATPLRNGSGFLTMFQPLSNDARSPLGHSPRIAVALIHKSQRDRCAAPESGSDWTGTARRCSARTQEPVRARAPAASRRLAVAPPAGGVDPSAAVGVAVAVSGIVTQSGGQQRGQGTRGVLSNRGADHRRAMDVRTRGRLRLVAGTLQDGLRKIGTYRSEPSSSSTSPNRSSVRSTIASS